MSEQVPMPHINLSISGYDPEFIKRLTLQEPTIQEFRNQYHNWMDLYLFHLELEESCQRIQDLNKDISKRVHIFKGLLHHHAGGNILVRVVMILIVMEEHMEIKDPLKEEDIKVRMGDHQIEEAIRIEDTLGEGIQIEMGDLLGRGGPPDGNGGSPDGNGKPPDDDG